MPKQMVCLHTDTRQIHYVGIENLYSPVSEVSYMKKKLKKKLDRDENEIRSE